MKQVLSYSFLLTSLASCGDIKDNASNSFDCMLYGEECPDAETRIGPEGKSGNEGISGPQGTPGPMGPAGPAGEKGDTGSRGEKGERGEDGSSCSATRVSNGATISCEDGSTVVIFDGIAGTDGQDGEDGEDGEDGADAPATAYSIVEVKDPCGDQSGFDEVLLRTHSGAWIAHFASGVNQFLTILTPGTYQTTDSTRCRFSLDSLGNIVNEVNY